jgi:MFS family permease
MGHDNAEKLNVALFWACFVALVATAFGFVVRSMVIGDIAATFNLTETEKGQILGVGLWPFALSIVLFSLIIDYVGYGRAMAFAFVCHVVSALLTIFANGYTMLYWGTFLVAIANGTVEAVINPVVATMFSKEKTKWLNILHAGWPGGLVLGGILALLMGEASWQLKIGLILLPTIIYGVMLLAINARGGRFPVHERVAAGVSYKEMLAEPGAIGALIVVSLMTWEITRVFREMGWLFVGWDDSRLLIPRLIVIVAITAAYYAYVRTLGRPMFIFLLIIMMPLATTELGTDTWISDLMTPEMAKLGLAGGWVLVYTSFIMMVLRFFAGPIVHALSPLGLLATCAAIAAVGLLALSKSAGITILLAATLYAFGKTFFWPTMLGVVAERFPKGGALTINSIAGVGMLSVGIVGAQFLGYFQDRSVDANLMAQNPTLHAKYVTQEKFSLFGKYKALNEEAVKQAPTEEKSTIDTIIAGAKKNALAMVAVFPTFMFVCYLILIAYFRSIGGYQAVHLESEG